MPKQHRRPTLKVRLPASAEADAAMRIVADWKTARQMSSNVAKAITLYAALQSGDVSKLRAAFPFLAAALGGLPSGGLGAYSAATAPLATQSTDEVANADDFGAALGLDDLEF